MKKIILSSVLAFGLVANAQIPTTDGADIGNDAAQFVLKLKAYSDRYTMIGNQIKGLQEFKAKLEGVTTYGQLQDLFKDIPPELVDSVSFISGNTGGIKI